MKRLQKEVGASPPTNTTSSPLAMSTVDTVKPLPVAISTGDTAAEDDDSDDLEHKKQDLNDLLTEIHRSVFPQKAGSSVEPQFRSKHSVNAYDNENEQAEPDGVEMTPTQKRDTVVKRIDTDDLALTSKQKEYDLSKTDWQGRKKHKRNKSHPSKLDKEFKDSIKEKANSGQIPNVVNNEIDTTAGSATKYASINVKDDTYWGSLPEPSAAGSGVTGSRPGSRKDVFAARTTGSTILRTLTEEFGVPGHNVGVNTFKKIIKKPSQPISLCVFELENVLCTDTSTIHQRSTQEIANVDLKSMLLAFGGLDRLENIHWHMSQVIMNQKQRRSCFVITNELSDTVTSFLGRVDLLQYFRSTFVGPDGVERRLSHVVGHEHKLMQITEGKKHLMLMKLIKLTESDPDSVLYIGNDRDTIDHLTSIDLCHAYWVNTKGMIHHDLTALARSFFHDVDPQGETKF